MPVRPGDDDTLEQLDVTHAARRGGRFVENVLRSGREHRPQGAPFGEEEVRSSS
jgi:hypothetical protein